MRKDDQYKVALLCCQVKVVKKYYFLLLFFVAGSEVFGEWSSSLNKHGGVVLLTEDLKKKTGDTCGKIVFFDEDINDRQTEKTYTKVRFSNDKSVTDYIELSPMAIPFVKDELSGHFSPSCNLVWVGALDKGEVTNDAGEVVENHERYYCVFIALPQACVLAIRTDMMCSGKFDRSDQWIRDDGYPSLDLLSKGFPNIKKYISGPNSRVDPTLDVNNVLRCDPVSRDNVGDYLKVVNDERLGVSENLRGKIRVEVDALNIK